jgi:hypothetical protein
MSEDAFAICPYILVCWFGGTYLPFGVLLLFHHNRLLFSSSSASSQGLGLSASSGFIYDFCVRYIGFFLEGGNGL